MLDLFNDILVMSSLMILWTAFVTGFLGSGHCVGMCGGLVFAVAPTKMSNFTYQLGRLLCYSLLGFIGGSLGSFLTLRVDHPYLASVPTFFLGLFFIWMGLSQYQGKGVHMKLPHFVSRLNERFMIGLSVGNIGPNTRSFLVGLFTFLLPCGFLYGAVLVSVSLQNPLNSIGMMIFFWLGTVPAMSFAPQILKKVLFPIQRKYPFMLSLFFIVIGMATILMRVQKILMTEGATCH